MSQQPLNRIRIRVCPKTSAAFYLNVFQCHQSLAKIKHMETLGELLDLQVFEKTWKACIEFQEPAQNLPQQPADCKPLPLVLVALDALGDLDFGPGHITYSLEPATLVTPDSDATVQAVGSLLTLMLSSAIHYSAYDWLHQHLEEHSRYPGAVVLLQRHLFVLCRRIAQCRLTAMSEQEVQNLVQLCKRLYLSFCSIQNRQRYRPFQISNRPLDPTQFGQWLDVDGQDRQQSPSAINFGQWLEREKVGGLEAGTKLA
ncbi:hypothetical protein CDD82_1951 [Ophiocordyceps australis]|uniref:Uncharacterized protein n=1 Tax=Ophiocordyceps australis TaxID=1399860 RepID=A0A2C5Y699_9HYPO|nr:hypothetical protein CDD82_1951 [Ophiocordyceps australis]